jgi:hypothetical protein
MKRPPITSASPPRPCITCWSLWDLSLALSRDTRAQKTIRLEEGELAGVRQQIAGYLKELGVG